MIKKKKQISIHISRHPHVQIKKENFISENVFNFRLFAITAKANINFQCL